MSPIREGIAWLRAGGPGPVALASAIALVIVLNAGPTLASFPYDAGGYWEGSLVLLGRTNFDFAEVLPADRRGILTAIIYLPAAAIASTSGPAPGYAVLFQNSLAIATLGAVIIPRILATAITVRRRHVILSTALTGFVLAGFASTTLMDLWSLWFVALAIALLVSRGRWWRLVLAGALLSVAFNLRPAYFLIVALIALVFLAAHIRLAWAPVLGGLLGLVPQVAFNLANFGVFAVMPVNAYVADQQASYGAYAVRYDTVLTPGVDPWSFFCSPDMAAAVVASPTPVESFGALFVFLLGTLPDSALFSLQKPAASLLWTAHTPYAAASDAVVTPLGVMVALIAVAGLVVLLKQWRDSGLRRPGLTGRLVLALWLGAVVTIVGSTPETRFALPLVFVGLIGVLVAVPPARAPRPTRAGVVWAGIAAIGAILVITLGATGLAHPAPPGRVTAPICATL